jgi:hypothetical protein
MTCRVRRRYLRLRELVLMTWSMIEVNWEVDEGLVSLEGFNERE